MAKVKPTIRSIDQYSIAKTIAKQLHMPITLITEVIELEQKLTMLHVKKGYKVIKKNYITLTPQKKDQYSMKSRLDGKDYIIPKRVVVRVKLGLGFKTFVSNREKQMPEKLCRFVDEKFTDEPDKDKGTKISQSQAKTTTRTTPTTPKIKEKPWKNASN